MDIAMFDSKIDKQSDAFDSSCERFAAAHNLADVSRKTGIAVQMLRNKLNPGQPHQLTVAEMIGLYHATGDETLIDGALLCCGLTAVAIPESTEKPAMLTKALELSQAVGQLSGDAIKISATGRVTRTERDRSVGVATAAMGQLAIFIYEVEQRFASVPVLSCATDALLNGIPGVTA